VHAPPLRHADAKAAALAAAAKKSSRPASARLSDGTHAG
jgi:hypothetical protein